MIKNLSAVTKHFFLACATLVLCVISFGVGMGALGGPQLAWATDSSSGSEGSDPVVASVTIDGVTTEYSSFSEAVQVSRSSTKPCTLTLLKDYTYSAMSDIDFSSTTNARANITFDLNGYTLTTSQNLKLKNVNFTLCNSDTSQEGKIISASHDFYCYENSTLVINSGTVEAHGGSAVYICESNCSLTVNGGKLFATNNYAISSAINTSIEINGGTIENLGDYQTIRLRSGSVDVGGSAKIARASASKNAIVASKVTVKGNPTIVGTILYSSSTNEINLSGYEGEELSIKFNDAHTYEGQNDQIIKMPTDAAKNYGLYCYVDSSDANGSLVNANKEIKENTTVYVEPYHIHKWTYYKDEANDAITAKCSGKRSCDKGKEITISLNGSESSYYDGKEKASVSQEPEKTASNPNVLDLMEGGGS